MLRPGRYKAEQDGDVFHAYRYVMEVKETEKSYIFKMVETVNRYADNQVETMFGGKSVERSRFYNLSISSKYHEEVPM